MNASQAHHSTADKPAQTTAGTVKEINAGACIIRVLNDSQIEIDDNPAGMAEEFFCYGPYDVPDTRDLDTIIAVVSKHDWTEAQLNDAIADLIEKEERLCAKEGEGLAPERNYR